MPWKRTDVMEQRIQFVAQAVRDSVNFSALCREYEVARSTGYRWVRRYLEVGHFHGLREKSRRPHRSPHKTSEAIEVRIEALHRQYGWGARKLRELLLSEGAALPVITIHRILKRRGLLREEKGHRPAVHRFERARPNELWQMDFKGPYPTRTGRCYPLSILDDHSRYAIGIYALDRLRSPVVHESVVDALETYGVPDGVLFDHGPPWWSTTGPYGLTWVAVSLIKQGIRIHLSGVRHPQTQGKVERFHRTLGETVRHRGRPQTLSGFHALFRSIRHEYNHIRPHEALDMAVPASRYTPSLKPYKTSPPDWKYPGDFVVQRLNRQGSLRYQRKCYFVCEALAGEPVGLQTIEKKLLVVYRHMYIREIDLISGTSKPLVEPKDPYQV